ncbi:glucose-6-phosphate dehydrogenase [Sphingomonas sp. BIUV-7]|uniref:Glucose-6-phosphate 1-dehydrogenase n=1 Tax=Sphingomonas natans TaxID=3063330 RepID=A0ABT8Y9N6_9SPHN|nr:glucose-6-phosphate dehydrogenase [Sphingomonas sp. BIUV-7]MDO6415052.1 glucose-6-phosphate dehydrogenase [Sphingomonas sp. BIUV-7]
MRKPPVAPPATFVIFGALGDLTRRLLAPALVNLVRDGLLGKGTRVLGVAHTEGDDQSLRDVLDDYIEDKSDWPNMSANVHYRQGDFTKPETFAALAKELTGNVVFYLATAPGFFGTIVEALGDVGLLDEKDGFRRVVIEKPFGTDLESARALNKLILARASEEQIYRIDHFLGKETVQNILVTRFGNALMEAVWNRRYIDHVEITAAEVVTVGTRGAFYDATGALRDMVPNHLFQLLSLVGMEPPGDLSADAIRTEKAKVIAAVRPISPDDAVRGRYAKGKIGTSKVVDYVAEADVDPKSRTETFVALKVAVETWRWSGVPFYLRTGKAMSARDTEIVIHFRDAPLSLFPDAEGGKLPPDKLILQIQPNEGVSLEIAAKAPGPIVAPVPVALNFAYADRFDIGHRTGYETLLYDVLIGDQTLFQRADQIEGGWAAVQPLLDAWGKKGKPHAYKAGSDGPPAAADLLERDGRSWHSIS